MITFHLVVIDVLIHEFKTRRLYYFTGAREVYRNVSSRVWLLARHDFAQGNRQLSSRRRGVCGGAAHVAREPFPELLDGRVRSGQLSDRQEPSEAQHLHSHREAFGRLHRHGLLQLRDLPCEAGASCLENDDEDAADRRQGGD